MVAKSITKPPVRRSSSLYAGTYQTPQRKLPVKAAVLNLPNKDTSRSGQDLPDAKETHPALLFLVMVDHIVTAHVYYVQQGDDVSQFLTREDRSSRARKFLELIL